MAGHKGTKHTEEWKRKVSLTNKLRGIKPPSRLGKHNLSGNDHPLWKGEKAGSSAIHYWIARKLGKPSKCEFCGNTQAKIYDWANKDHKYRRRLEDWMRLCRSCHRNYDFERIHDTKQI